MYQLDKTDKKLLGSRIEDALLEYILQAPVEVGQKIPNEFELAEQFGVGRSTIREAVKGLASRGILEVRRGAGTYVISTRSVEDDPLGLSRFQDKYQLALELFDVRLMLEPEIAALACEGASEEELNRLKELCEEIEELCRQGKDYIEKDIEFHTCIARCSRNRVVEILIPVINSAVITFANLTHRTLISETLDTHRAVMDAIFRKDAVGARCAMIMHLTYNRQAIMRMLDENRS
ncbi:MAG: FadR family transcriptional regulator [Lachnospiraceae bacterium]|nr:FadR family transcriptional regulator [Lachnospiraceae bacterium]